jgi:hypothetical protein
MEGGRGSDLREGRLGFLFKILRAPPHGGVELRGWAVNGGLLAATEWAGNGI